MAAGAPDEGIITWRGTGNLNYEGRSKGGGWGRQGRIDTIKSFDCSTLYLRNPIYLLTL